MFTAYGFLGMNHTKYSGRYDGRRASVDPAIAVGLLLTITPQLSAYIEAMHVIDPWFGLGLRWHI